MWVVAFIGDNATGDSFFVSHNDHLAAFTHKQQAQAVVSVFPVSLALKPILKAVLVCRNHLNLATTRDKTPRTKLDVHPDATTHTTTDTHPDTYLDSHPGAILIIEIVDVEVEDCDLSHSPPL